VLEDDSVEEEVVEEEEEEDEPPWMRLHLTIEDWLKFPGQTVNGGQQALLAPSASKAINCQRFMSYMSQGSRD